jgi:hypothetical protein
MAAPNPSLHDRLSEALTIVADASARIGSTWGDFRAIVPMAMRIHPFAILDPRASTYGCCGLGIPLKPSFPARW